ncbi:phosphatase PAP2 family protein [Candidatus Gracilibacteria bacterium]|nr:phosphatase PAP2 family protein [Candidatus Gracilibacteria bacterium]
MNILSSILEIDLSLLQSARQIIPMQYASYVQIAGELIVIYAAILLISLWIYGVIKGDNSYKKIALSIFYTIVLVFIFYAIINLGIPKWRLGAMEIPGAIMPLIPHPADNSFPSGHALFTGALLFGIVAYFRKTSLIVATILIGLVTLVARVMGGVHYPGDIIGGLLIGIVCAYFLRHIVGFLILKTSDFLIKIASFIRL